MSATITEGTYLISTQLSSLDEEVCMEFKNITAGTVLTSVMCNSEADEQRWTIIPTTTSANQPAYFIKNDFYQTYIAFNSNVKELLQYVYESKTEYFWFAQNYENGFVFSADAQNQLSWTLNNGNTTEGNPVLIYDIKPNDVPNTVWILNEASPMHNVDSQSTGGLSSSTKIALGAGIGLGVPFLLLLTFVIYVGARRAARKQKPYNKWTQKHPYNKWTYDQFDDAASGKRFELGKVSPTSTGQ